MPTILRPVLSRVLAAAVGALATWLNLRWGVTLDAETSEALIAVALFVFGAVYALVHRVFDSKFNPTDAAKPKVAEAEKRQVDAGRV